MSQLNDNKFYSRYCSFEGQVAMGVLREAHQLYRARGRTTDEVIPSMLLLPEVALLYALARHHFRAEGAIVDLGPLLGLSTFAMARGLSDNPSISRADRAKAIYSFDLFRFGSFGRFFKDNLQRNRTGSLLDTFVAVNHDHLDSIVINQGDFTEWDWDGSPIEILFVDLAKSWALNHHIISNMFPCLIPDRSIVCQQDWVHFNEYWVHIAMEYHRKSFERLGFARGATAYFRVVAPLSVKECSLDLSTLSYAEKMRLLEAARSDVPPLVEHVMLTGAAKCAIDCGELDDAKRLLSMVDIDVADDGLDFRGVLRSNLKLVKALLESSKS